MHARARGMKAESHWLKVAACLGLCAAQRLLHELELLLDGLLQRNRSLDRLLVRLRDRLSAQRRPVGVRAASGRHAAAQELARRLAGSQDRRRAGGREPPCACACT